MEFLGLIVFLLVLFFVILPIFFGVSRAVENAINPKVYYIIKDDEDCYY